MLLLKPILNYLSKLKEYLNKWTIKRFLQLVVGIFFIYYYTKDNNQMALFFGILMLVQAILNMGCFSTRGCDTKTTEANKQDFSRKIKKIN